MNRHDFIRVVAKNGDCTVVEAKKLINVVFNSIVDLLRDGETVSISGFGKFYTKDVKELTIHSPWTKEEFVVPAHTAPAFSYFDAVKESVKAV